MADPAQIAHLLRRTEYVARPARVTALSAGTLEAAVDDILDVTTPVPLPVDIDHNIEGEGWEQYVFATQWWMDRMVDAPKPMQEKMTFFWHGHFTSAYNKVGDLYAIARQNKLYRDNALGNFYDLTQAMAIQPAMLSYLDNSENTKGSPNQNFARELLELFTLGIGNYAESDVEAAARAWTGHGLEWDAVALTDNYLFRLSRHDTNNKVFFGKTQNWDGPQIITEILQTNPTKKLIAARFIIKKLWEYFAHPNPPAAVLNALETGFAADWDVKKLVKAMLLRPEFYSAAAMEGQVRSPVEWVVAVMYYTGRRSAELHPEWYMEGMGQVPFNPPNVAGWKANGYWVNTSTVGERADFAKDVANRMRTPDTYAYISARTGNVYTTSIDTAVDTIANLFGIAPLSTVSRNAIAGYLSAERTAANGNTWWQVTNLLTMGMVAPEMHVA